MMNTKLRRISGDVFCHDLHDALNLDGLILQVCYGFNPIDAAWNDYRRNVNPRIDANTMVYDYNSPERRVPTREQFPMVIFQELEVMVSRGCRRIATNPLWYIETQNDHVRKGGMEADKMMDDAINAWLCTGDNASRVDVIYVVDKYAKGVPSWRDAAMCLDSHSYTDYLKKGFHKDVSAWFDSFRLGRKYFYAQEAVITSDGDGLKGSRVATLPFKVASMYACVLTHAAVAATREKEAIFAMSRVLGFPLVDRLMAGYVNPMTALEVSGLLPTNQEKAVFFDLAHAVWDQVRGVVSSVCETSKPKSMAEDYIHNMVAPKEQNMFAIVESYLMAIERYLTGESEYRPTDLVPFEI